MRTADEYMLLTREERRKLIPGGHYTLEFVNGSYQYIDFIKAEYVLVKLQNNTQIPNVPHCYIYGFGNSKFQLQLLKIKLENGRK